MEHQRGDVRHAVLILPLASLPTPFDERGEVSLEGDSDSSQASRRSLWIEESACPTEATQLT
jgi:hypothetical protein